MSELEDLIAELTGKNLQLTLVQTRKQIEIVLFLYCDVCGYRKSLKRDEALKVYPLIPKQLQLQYFH